MRGHRWSRTDAAIARISEGAAFLGGLAVLLMTGLISFDVLMRYFLGEPQLFVDEVSGFLQVLAIFWGLAHTFRANGHIRVDLVTSRVPPTVRARLRVVTLATGIALLAIVTWTTWESAWTAYRYGRVSTVMLYPLWLPMLLIPTGLALMAFAMASTLARQLRRTLGREEGRDEVAPDAPA